MDPAFVGSHGDINGTSALVVPADALYHCHLFFGDLPGIQPNFDLGGQKNIMVFLKLCLD